jgi:hypothetical protein
MMLTDTETARLQARVVELELRMEGLERRFEALGELVDEMIVFLKRAHRDGGPPLAAVEAAAEKALAPD